MLFVLTLFLQTIFHWQRYFPFRCIILKWSMSMSYELCTHVGTYPTACQYYSCLRQLFIFIYFSASVMHYIIDKCKRFVSLMLSALCDYYYFLCRGSSPTWFSVPTVQQCVAHLFFFLAPPDFYPPPLTPNPTVE